MKTPQGNLRTGILLLALLAFSACGAPQEGLIQPGALAGAQATPQPVEYTIQAGDQLEIKFFYNPELNEAVTVRPDGMITLQLMDDVRAAGRTPAQLDAFLTQAYAKELQKPVVTVIVRSFSGQRIFVGGEVKTEGLLTLLPGMTPLQAVFQAGGFLETSAPDAAILIRKGPNNDPIPVAVDLKSALRGAGPAATMAMLSDDVLYVPKSPIANANLFVKQYIENLLMFRGFSFGYTYEFYRNSGN